VSIRTNRVLILVSALGYFFFSGLRTFAVVFLRDRFGIAQGVASILLVVIGVGAIVGVLATGRLGDWLIERRHITARPLVGGLSFLLAAAVPARAAHHLPAGRRTVAVLRRSRGRRANPPLDAARLDLMHSRLWGRAVALRTFLRSALEAIAPLLFGYVSTLFGAHTGGLGSPPATPDPRIRTGRHLPHHASPLTVAGLLLVLRARSTYSRDVATAAERNTRTDPRCRPRRGQSDRDLRMNRGSRSACGQFGAAVSARG